MAAGCRTQLTHSRIPKPLYKMGYRNTDKFLLGLLAILLVIPGIFSACSTEQQIGRIAGKNLLGKEGLLSAHTGICIYDPAQKKYLYQYQADKYFTPASNTKILTCYAVMKFLGDSLPGLRVLPGQDRLLIFPTGDPTLLHADFSTQPVVAFLAKQVKPVFFIDDVWKENPFGEAWAWDDYPYDYSAERAPLPVYGNVVTITGSFRSPGIVPEYFRKDLVFQAASDPTGTFPPIIRSRCSNQFVWDTLLAPWAKTSIPFITSDSLAIRLLSEASGQPIRQLPAGTVPQPEGSGFLVYSQPTDSLLKIMMHRSDNFYAEQSLLMLSNQLLGVMSDAKIIDTLLKTVYARLPQAPQWVDGSGLSRHNLISPRDFVYVLANMQETSDWNRITTIFASAGNGTLGELYRSIPGKIYAKTGSMNGVVTLSGFLVTRKGRRLVFSVLVNNQRNPASQVRSQVRDFLGRINERF